MLKYIVNTIKRRPGLTMDEINSINNGDLETTKNILRGLTKAKRVIGTLNKQGSRTYRWVEEVKTISDRSGSNFDTFEQTYSSYENMKGLNEDDGRKEHENIIVNLYQNEVSSNLDNFYEDIRIKNPKGKISELIKTYFEVKLSKEKGKITSSKIAKDLGISDSNIRSNIIKVIENNDFPITSDNQGYHWVDSDEKLFEVIWNSNMKIKTILERIDALKRNFNKYYGGK